MVLGFGSIGSGGFGLVLYLIFLVIFNLAGLDISYKGTDLLNRETLELSFVKVNFPTLDIDPDNSVFGYVRVSNPASQAIVIMLSFL